MATQDFNPHNPAVFYGTTEHPALRSEFNKVYTTGALIDDATYVIGAATSGVGFYRCWDSEDLTNAAEFSVDADGTVTLVVPIWTGAVWVAADTDTKLCFFSDSGTLTVKNRSGGTLTLHFAKLL